MDDRLHLTLAELWAADGRDDAAAGAGHPASALKPEVSSAAGVAVVGHDGYIFIGNGANRWERQFLGELQVADIWLDTWTAVLAARQAEAARRRIPLWNLVIPEKQVIYPEKRWPQAQDPGGRRPLVQLMSRLGKEARLLYPQAELVASRELAPAYSRHDSHWTPSGCVAAAAALAGSLGAEVDFADLKFAGRRLCEARDLTKHLFEPPPQEAFTQLVSPGEEVFRNDLLAANGHRDGSGCGLHNAAAPDPRSLIVFGDSYSYEAGLAPALSAVFAEVVVYWSKSVIWELVAQHRADLVVWESVERFLATTPQA